jgi:hypothetical protein
MMAALRFRSGEIILDCFQKGRMSQWARAHFFVGRENGVSAGVTVGADWKRRPKRTGTED